MDLFQPQEMTELSGYSVGERAWERARGLKD